MWYIVLIDIENRPGKEKHRTIECVKDADTSDYTQAIGYSVAGKFNAESEQDAIRLALETDPSDWEGCVA